MKKNVILLATLLLPYFLLAQGDAGEFSGKTGGGSNGSTQGGISISGIYTFDNGEESVKGTRFYFDDWSEGSVLYNNKRFTKDLQYRYDVVSNELHIKFSDNSVRIPENPYILEFDMTDNKGKKHHFEHAVVEGEKIDQFYEILYAGKQVQLMKQIKKKLRKADNKDAYLFQRNDELVPLTKYYLRTTPTADFETVKMKQKTILSAFPAYKIQLKKLFDSEEYSDINEDTFPKILEYIEKELLK